MNIHPNAKTILHILHRNGYDAYLVGGCVRDLLRGEQPHDWDICTNALPQQLKQCFADFTTFDAGIRHGTLSVVIDNEVYEVTTFRIDGDYRDNRHPESVSFTTDLIQDLSRRDFTVNAMAYDEQHGVIDPFCGQEDLQKGIIRCVGTPSVRFTEDALRILRALRFASAYGFQMEDATDAAIRKHIFLLDNISMERKQIELCKLLCGKDAERILRDYREVIGALIPELRPTFDFEQRTPHHCFDVYNHIIRSVSLIAPEPLLRMTMLLHDIGKPQACTTDADGRHHFKGHPAISAQLAEDILQRFRFSRSFCEECIRLITYHDVRYDGSLQQIKRLLNRIGSDSMERLLQIQLADTMAQSLYLREQKLAARQLAQEHMQQILEQRQCFSLQQLAVNGNDLLATGISDGKAIGQTLQKLLDAVIDDEVDNQREQLLAYAKTL